ncbi:hypothetical protein AVEN_127213-1 [Araneus ventricosus]|uniref:Uncharacterized protein n=1 Tax=Araneus ventricosus TaxID=182803 RepID=A0A4Y2VMC0_ARAVE|nr:hypothetical protein AVEN_246845-1 [Araneus ventricosus]GBO26470.1 hypothetical protein AVEN_154711-1 [Araneus ventricosus]GBO26477.1 hypothetical protein AVEN_36337-1 [Araneus ventricosus]GBO26483.1 hypothetical protein AVEN_127213-1 [Araneus ventricosus]
MGLMDMHCIYDDAGGNARVAATCTKTASQTDVCQVIHCLEDVRAYIYRIHHHNCTGRGGPVSWPPPSPDFISMDFYLWTCMESMVYDIRVTLVINLVSRIVEAVSGGG